MKEKSKTPQQPTIEELESPQVEKEKQAPKILSIDKLSAEQTMELQSRIEKSRGNVMVYVHPFFPEEESIETQICTPDDQKLERMRDSLQKLLQVQKKDTPPIFIFEERDNIGKLISRIESWVMENVYVIPTDAGFATPDFEAWESLNQRLINLGVHQITLSGMNLVVLKNFAGKTFPFPQINGCVAETAEELSKKFDVTISKNVYPNSREDYQTYHPKSGVAYRLKQEILNNLKNSEKNKIKEKYLTWVLLRQLFANTKEPPQRMREEIKLDLERAEILEAAGEPVYAEQTLREALLLAQCEGQKDLYEKIKIRIQNKKIAV